MSGKGERFDSIVDQLRVLIDHSVSEKHEQQQAVSDAAATLSSGDMSELILGARRVRNRHFGSKLFGEPAWDILLELHIAHHKGQSVSITSAVTSGDTAPTTGLRWLATLERDGLVERRSDPLDNRRQFVGLTADGVAKLDGYVEAFAKWAATKATMRKL